MSASKAFAFSLALLLGAGGPVSAQNTVDYDGPVVSGDQSSGSVSGTTAIGNAGGYFWVQGDFGERPGILGNNASFGSFAPIDFLDPDTQFFIDSQVMVNDDAELGASVGLGYRHLVDPWGSIFGINGFYTFDQSRNKFSYNQGGVGAEWLTEYFQVTSNAYLPFDSQPNAVGAERRTNNSVFLNNNLAFNNFQNAETQLRGADLDVAVPIPGAEWLSVAGGGYWYDGKHAESYKGFRGRLQADFTNVLLNLSLTKDDVAGNQANFAATYLFGAQNGNYSPRAKTLYDRMNDRVRRTSRIATQGVVINTLELAINPRTGLPWTFAHFDNTAAAGGDGSNELRYNGLVPSNPSDALLFHRGTTTRTNLLTGGTGIVLNDHQLVFGEGCPTFIDVANRPGGPTALPTSWATTGANPFVTAGAGSNVFTLADNNRIAGLNIIAPTGGNAIVGNGIQNFTLEKLNRNVDPTVAGVNGTTGTGGGIVINNARGTGIIRDFGFNIPSTGGPSGIVINNVNTAPLNVAISDGRFLNGGLYGVDIEARNSTINSTINNVNNTGSATGLQLQARNAGRINTSVTNSHFDNAVGGGAGTGDGISAIANDGEINLTVQDSSALNAARNGLNVAMANGSTGSIGLTTVDLSSAGNDAIRTSLDDSTLNLGVTGVNGSGAGDDGFDFQLSNASGLLAGISNSNFSNAGTGLPLVDGDGLVGSLTGGSTATVAVSNTSFADADGNGVFVTTAGASTSTLSLNNSNATSAGQNGLLARSVQGSLNRISLVNQSFNGAGQDAIHLEANDVGSRIFVTGNGVSGENASGDGIQIAANQARVDLNLINNGSFLSAGEDGLNFSGLNQSLVNIDIAGPSVFDGAGGDGIDGTLNNSTGTLNLNLVTFRNATTGDGIRVNATTNSTFNGVVTNGSFMNAGLNAAILNLNDSIGNLTLDTTSLANAQTRDALHVEALSGSTSIVQLLNGISLDNAGDGAGDNAIDVIATGSTVTVTGNQTRGRDAGDDAIQLAANNGQITLQLLRAGSFVSPGGDGIDFSGINRSTLNMQVQGLPLASFFDAGRHGVLGNLSEASTATLGLTDTNFASAGMEGLLVTATELSVFNGSVTNGSFANSGAGHDAIQLNLNNATGNLALNAVTAVDAGGHALNITADAASTSTSTMVNGVQLDRATLDAIHVDSNAASNVLLSGSGVTGSFAGDDGIELNVQAASQGRVLLDNAGSFSDAFNHGIAMRSVGVDSLARIDVTGPLASFDRAGVLGGAGDGVNASILSGAGGLLSLNDVSIQNVQNNGIAANVVGANSQLNGTLTDVALDNAATGDALQLNASALGRIGVTGTRVSGSNAGRDGINLRADNARIDLALAETGSFAGAGNTVVGDGIDFLGTSNSLINLTVSGTPTTSFDGASGNGIIGDLTSSTAAVNLTNVTFRDAALDGLHLDLKNNSVLTGNILGSDFSRTALVPSAGHDGVDIRTDNSDVNLTITAPINNASDDAIHLEALAASNLTLKVNGGPILNAGGDMTDILFLGGSVVNYTLDPAATGANQNGLRFNGAGAGSVLNANILNSHMSTASDPVGENGILGTLNTNAVANVNLVNSDISNAGADGINVTAAGGSRFNATLTNSSVSNAGEDGLDLTLTNAFSTILFDNSDLNDAVGDAIRVNGTDSTLSLTLANGISLDDAGENAIDVTGVRSTINVIGMGLVTGANAGVGTGGDAVSLVGTNSTINLLLANAGSFANAGGDGIGITGNNTDFRVQFRGAAAGAANLDGAGDNGIAADLNSGSTIAFDVNNFSIQGSGQSGINLDLDASQVLASTFTNGQVDNNGTDDPGDGLRIVADSGSSIGNRVGNTAGLTFNGVTLRNDPVNPLQVPRTQEHGVNVSVDNDSYVGLNVLNADISRNDGDGILVRVNDDNSNGDSSLAVLNFTNTQVNNNWGDGLNVVARNGIDDVVPPQVSGAIISFTGSEINRNGNFNNKPATGVIGDGIGNGIDASAFGDNTVAGNTQITINLTDTDVLGNEEDPTLNSMTTDGGSVNFNLVDGTIDGNLNIACADGPLAFNKFTLNGTTIGSATALVLCAKNQGVLDATVANVSFNDNGGQGIVILAETGGDVIANLSNISVQRNGTNPGAPIDASVNPPITTVTGAIQGVVDGVGGLDGIGSSLTLTINDLTVTDNDVAGLDLTVSNGGQLDAVIQNSDFSDNGQGGAFDGLLIDVSGGGSDANVRLVDVLANNATDDGLDFRATGGANLDLVMDTVAGNSAGADGLSLLVDGGTASLDLDGLSVNDADGRAVNLIATTNSTLAVTNLDNVTGRRAGLEGLNLDVLNGSDVTVFNSETVNVSGSGRLNPVASGVDILVDTGSTTSLLDLRGLNANDARGRGLQLVATDPASTQGGLSLTDSTFTNAGITGVDVSIANQATPANIVMTRVNADDAGNRGVLLNLNAVTGGLNVITLDNVTGNNAGTNDGLEINLTGMGATDTAQINISNNSSFDNAQNEGVDINLNGALGSSVSMMVDGLSADDARNDGINIRPTGGTALRVSQFDNVTATNAGSDGVDVFANGPSSLLQFVGQTIDVNGAGQNGIVLISGNSGSGPSVLSLDGVNASNAANTGVFVNLFSVPGDSSVSLSNIDATGAVGGNGVLVNSTMTNAGDSIAITLNTVDVSNAGGDGLHVYVRGNGVAGDTSSTLALDGLTATGDVRDGIDLNLSSGVTASVTQFDNVVSTLNRENGMQIDVLSGSTLTAFVSDGLDLSNNAQSGRGFDGLDIQVRDAGSSAAFELSNLTINQTNLAVNNGGGRGIDLDVYNGGTLRVDLATATIDQSGLQGIDLNVGSEDEFPTTTSDLTGTFTGTWRDVTVTNSGQSPLQFADGVNVDVDGAGSSANLTLDHVVSNNNDQDGFDIRVHNGANGTFAVNNATTGNANQGTGFKFAADGLGTVVSLTSAAGALGDNTFNNNVGDPLTNLDGPGVSVTLTDRVTATNLIIGASASGNDGDGLQVLANDGSGVTIGNFGISGTALQVNNNLGNGLFIDFNAVLGVNAFDLANVTVTGNGIDQIHAQFRDMTMDHISLDQVTTTGTATSDDGIEISLLDTQLTRPAANGYAFSATNVVSTNNGGFGLNLSVDESGVPGGAQSAGITNGLIRLSEFANNGAAGVRMSFGGDSVADFDIIDNTAGFHDNDEEGILIEVQDNATYRMNGTNLVLAGANSMYNNQITDNGGIGFRLVASEPLDTNLIVPDAIGPRVELDLGDALRNPNTITGNVDAAMAIEMSGDATGSFSLVSSILTETTNGVNTNFNGDGLAFRLNNFAALESLTIDGAGQGLDISDNAGSGLVTSVNEFAELGTNTRLTVLNTTIQRNDLHGIDIQRNDDGLYGPDFVNNAIIIGSLGNGNTIRDNTQNGLNIVLNNAAGALPPPFTGLPLNIDVTDNRFERNLNGIFLNATGNSQFQGNISDNDFDGQLQDGIQVVLENNAAIGDPNLATNAARDPFFFDGNQILNSARDGIRFDTNFTNERLELGGGAYANILIRDSQNVVDGFGVAVRTLIDGNGLHGVEIIDNSDFAGSLATNATIQNQYRIIATDITNNAIDGIHVNVGANANIRDANNGIALIVGDRTAANQRDVQINRNGDDGIDLELSGADSNTNNIDITHSTLNFNGLTAADATGGNGIETDVRDTVTLSNGTFHFAQGSVDMLLETLDIQSNADDGTRFDVTSTRGNQTKSFDGVATTTNAVSLVEMFGVDASNNGNRGLYALLQNDRIRPDTFDAPVGFHGTASQTVFNIGRGDRTVDLIAPGDPGFTDEAKRNSTYVNRFNGNDGEGVVFDLQAVDMDQDTTTKPNGWPHPNGIDANDDVFVDVNQQSFHPNPVTRWSTDHAIAGINPGTTSGLASGETYVNLASSVNFIHNEVSNNGSNAEDGLVLAIGALTQLNAVIGGNSFGSNRGDDIFIYPQQSNDINPPDSFNDQSNDAGHTYIIHDPVAYANIVLGSIDADLDGFIDQVFGNGRSADASTAAANGIAKGEQINVLTFGTNQTNTITNDGVFDNNDPVKGGGRSVLLVGQIQVNGTWEDEVINNFVENGVQQIIDNQFFFFDQSGNLQIPDPAFP